MVRRILLAFAMVAASVPALAVAAATAAPATQQCPASYGSHGGVKVPLSDVPVTISVTDVSTAAATDVVVTFTDNGTRFALTLPEPTSEALADASWCVKSATVTTSPLFGTDTEGGTPATNKKNRAQRIGHVVIYTVTTAETATCYDAPGYYDLQVTGAVGVVGNANTYNSIDGSCTDGTQDLGGILTVVIATSLQNAQAVCGALTTPSYAYDRSLADYGWIGVPEDYWACLSSP